MAQICVCSLHIYQYITLKNQQDCASCMSLVGDVEEYMVDIVRNDIINLERCVMTAEYT